MGALGLDCGRLHSGSGVYIFFKRLFNETIVQVKSMASEAPEQARAKSSLELLYSISRELAAQLDIDKLLRRVLQLTMEATGPPNGSILILDEDGSITDGALAYDGKLFEHTGERLADTYRQGLAGWVVEHKQPALIPDTGEDERWLQRHSVDDDGSPRSA